MPKLIHTLFAVFLCYTANAQNNDRFTNYGVNEGLSQSSIDEINQDKDGFLWVGTAGGLCRFDGYNFKVYRQSSQDPAAISSDRGFHFYNDRDGRPWIISYNGLSLYNSLTDNFTNLIIYQPKNLITIENHFFGEDETFIWAGLCNYGIVKIDKQSKKVYRTNIVAPKQHPTPNAWYHGFMEKGRIWGIDNNEFNKPIFFIHDIRRNTTDTLPIPATDIVNMNDSEILAIQNKGTLLINKKDHTSQFIKVMEDGSEPNILTASRLSASEALLSSPVKGLFYLDIHT